MTSFSCVHCSKKVTSGSFIGTANRNHCPFCLWSKHVDKDRPGDRKSECQAPMQPIGLTFKQEGFDKYGKLKQGELMLVHWCTKGNKLSINRIAADDNSEMLLEILSSSIDLDEETRQKLNDSGVKLLTEDNRQEIKKQLFGKNYPS